MNSLIEFLEKNTHKRKKIKDRIDSELNLSAVHDGEPTKLTAAAYGSNKNRLLDEGAVIEGDGSVYAYIKKGTIEKFMNRDNVHLDNLPEDFVGNINIGHMDHATFPFPVGNWSMENMSMVDIGDGRKGIDIDVTVDAESMFIKELERIGYDVSMSAEFYTHTDWEATEDLGMWVIDEILITAYAIVGDGKNVNSNGLRLKGEIDMTKEQLEALKSNVPDTEETELSAMTEEGTEEDIQDTETAIKPDEADDKAELSVETEEAEEAEQAELSAGEETNGEEANEGEEAEGEEATYEEVEAFVASLQEQICQLRAENAELKKTNKRLNKKLKTELASKSDFVSKFKTLAESTGVSEKETQERDEVSDYIFGDGIGE